MIQNERGDSTETRGTERMVRICKQLFSNKFEISDETDFYEKHQFSKRNSRINWELQ